MLVKVEFESCKRMHFFCQNHSMEGIISIEDGRGNILLLSWLAAKRRWICFQDLMYLMFAYIWSRWIAKPLLDMRVINTLYIILSLIFLYLIISRLSELVLVSSLFAEKHGLRNF